MFNRAVGAASNASAVFFKIINQWEGLLGALPHRQVNSFSSVL